ncbi:MULTISPECIES: hypothetical protein [unclassified Saccharothrix]
MAPHAAYFPDLLTPPEDLSGIDECVEAVLSTGRSASVRRSAGSGPPPVR